jgi:hypothetical protein
MNSEINGFHPVPSLRRGKRNFEHRNAFAATTKKFHKFVNIELKFIEMLDRWSFCCQNFKYLNYKYIQHGIASHRASETVGRWRGPTLYRDRDIKINRHNIKCQYNDILQLFWCWYVRCHMINLVVTHSCSFFRRSVVRLPTRTQSCFPRLRFLGLSPNSMCNWDTHSCCSSSYYIVMADCKYRELWAIFSRTVWFITEIYCQRFVVCLRKNLSF